MRLSNSNKKIQAFTIVELMVAMLLSLFLIGGILSVYLTGKQTYRSTQGLAQIQSNLRFTMDMFSRDLRMAGYMPCRYQPNLSTVISGTNWWQNFFAQTIQGFEGGVGPNTFTPELASETMAPNSDGVAIFKSDDFQVTVASLAGNRINAVSTIPATTLTVGETAIICDAHQATLFQISNRGANFIEYDSVAGNIAPGTCTNGLASIGTAVCGDVNSGDPHQFQNNVQLARYSPVIYYVAESLQNPGVLALKRRYFQSIDNAGTETATMFLEELLQGVESMQIRYGIDTDSDQVANRFLRANAVTAANWSNVVSIKLGLLLISDDQVATQMDNNTYNVAGESITAPGDLRMRQVANYTISLRNRVRDGTPAAIAVVPP